MGLSKSVAETQFAVSVPEVKRHLRITDNDEDSLIRTLIGAATQHAEHVTNRQLVTATYIYTLQSWSDIIRLPRPPLQNVSKVEYIDTDGVTQTLSTDVYAVYTNEEPGYIALKYNQSWPSLRTDTDPISITYVAGYEDVPEGIKAALKLHVGHLFEHRESVDISSMARVTEVPMAYDSLIWGYKVPVI